MEQNQNNGENPLPAMPEMPQNTPQVFGPQQTNNPETPASVTPPQVTQPVFTAPQAQTTVSATPVSGQLGLEPAFTSNPFLSFGKGLGSGLFFSPGTIIGAGAVIMLLMIAIGIVGGLVSGLLTSVSPILGFIAVLVILVIGAIVAEQIFARTIIAFDKGGRKESITFKETGELVDVKTGLLLLGLAIVSGLIVTIGFILLIIPGLILLARLSLAPFILVVEKKGVFASLSRSWSLTKYHTWDMLGANFVQYIGGGSSLLLLPAVYAASANRYSELTSLEQQGFTGKTKTHWSNYLITVLVFVVVGLYFLLIATTLSTANNAANKLEKASKSVNTTNLGGGTFTVGNDSSSAQGKYCYYNGEISDSNAKYVCTDSKTECLANQFCKSDNSYQLN
jgi:hypothetical protein